MVPQSTSTVPLPATITRALTQIAAELADMPRECARDHGELCLWKSRLARRIRGVLEMRVPVAAQGSPNAPLTAIPGTGAAPGARTGANPPAAKKRGVRRIVDRRGRFVRVEVRQLEMPL